MKRCGIFWGAIPGKEDEVWQGEFLEVGYGKFSGDNVETYGDAYILDNLLVGFDNLNWLSFGRDSSSYACLMSI